MEAAQPTESAQEGDMDKHEFLALAETLFDDHKRYEDQLSKGKKHYEALLAEKNRLEVQLVRITEEKDKFRDSYLTLNESYKRKAAQTREVIFEYNALFRELWTHDDAFNARMYETFLESAQARTAILAKRRKLCPSETSSEIPDSDTCSPDGPAEAKLPKGITRMNWDRTEAACVLSHMGVPDVEFSSRSVTYSAINHLLTRRKYVREKKYKMWAEFVDKCPPLDEPGPVHSGAGGRAVVHL